LDGRVAAAQAPSPPALTKEELEEMGSSAEIEERAVDEALEAYETKEQSLGPDERTGQPLLRELGGMVMLALVDTKWREHLYEMDYLQEGIGLRAYGQRDPLVEYQREAFAAFEELEKSIREEFV